MNCPECKSKGSIINSRSADGTKTRRRYKCLQGHRWTTMEQVIEGQFHAHELEALEKAREEVREGILNVLGLQIIDPEEQAH